MDRRGDARPRAPTGGYLIAAADGWRERAVAEIDSIKPRWAKRYGWQPRTVISEPDENGDVPHVDLLVSFTGTRTGEKRFLLRLRYGPEYETEGRREAFVNPENAEEESIQFWPQSVDAIKATHSPPVVCLEGTWGFHRVLHKERDARVAKINKLLQEIQRCLDGKA